MLTMKMMTTKMTLIAVGRSVKMKNIPPNKVIIEVVDSLNSASFITGILYGLIYSCCLKMMASVKVATKVL